MGFQAEEAVEPMGFDFTAFGGRAASTPEPSNSQIAKFWKKYGEHVRGNRDRIVEFQDRLTAAGKIENDEQRVTAEQQIETEYEDAQEAISEQRKEQRCALFAALCSDQPSYDDLYALPGRILDAFEQYLLDALSPKALKTGTRD